MAQYIIPAIITGVVTILATALTVYKSDLSFVFRRQKRTVKGSWKGHAEEKLLNDPSNILTYEIMLQLYQIGSRVTGNARLRASNGEHYDINLKGQMEDDHFVTLVVRSANPQDFAFGVSLLELDAKGKTLNGYGLGNGLTGHGIALGTSCLAKEPN